MATILIHAGMPKAGSTAIQEYLRRHQRNLASRGIKVAKVSRAENDRQPIVVREYEGGTITSSYLVRAVLEQPEAKPAVMRALIRGLRQLARSSDLVVLTAEGLSQSMWRADPEFLRPLDELAENHSVRVAYYVRPQHAVLEARWRQWGFRMGRPPAAFIEDRAQQLRYLETMTDVRQTAPKVDFVVRPFRQDLLECGDVVVDFGRHFLGVEAAAVPPSPENLANVGLSLELINLLSCAPQRFFGPTPHDNERFERTKALLRDIHVPPSDDTQHGRQLLQGWSYERFERANRELIHQLEWPTDYFVPPTRTAVDDLQALNELWRPRASALEIAAFFKLLELQLARASN